MPCNRLHPRSRLTSLAALLLLSGVFLTSPAEAKELPLTADSIVFARDTSLFQISASGGTPSEIVKLPWQADKLSALLAAQNGSALLLQAEGFTAWLPLGSASPTLQYLPCTGKAQLSASGSKVVCQTQDSNKIAVYQLRPTLEVSIVDRAPNGPVYFGETSLVCYGDNQSLVACEDSTLLSSHRPTKDMLVSYDGKRAVGAYSEGQIDVTYTFKLDGQAAKRTLIPASRPVSIAAGLGWIALQQEIDACAVRLSGGQYMCWSRYQALDVSSQGKNLLLILASKKQGHDLYISSVSGTKSLSPNAIATGVGPLAVFLPSALPHP